MALTCCYGLIISIKSSSLEASQALPSNDREPIPPSRPPPKRKINSEFPQMSSLCLGHSRVKGAAAPTTDHSYNKAKKSHFTQKLARERKKLSGNKTIQNKHKNN